MSLGQFYTPPAAGSWLVEGVGSQSPMHICDLGVGQGELLLAARRRWEQARLLAADIDPDNVALARCRLGVAECRHVDALRYDLPSLLGIEEGSIDVALGNPPYGTMEIRAEHLAILRHAGLGDVISPKRVTRDVVFLAQNLRMLKQGGELAIILPEGVAVNPAFEDLRAALMERHGLHRVVELPRHLFLGAEARTVAMFLQKGRVVREILLENIMGDTVLVPLARACKRLDARYHLLESATGMVLGDIEHEIQRGALSHAEALALGHTTFHTTTFKHFPRGRVRLGKVPDCPDRWLVRAGDIVIPRVGSRCLAYAAIIERGGAVFTDCVYRIRVQPERREAVIRALRSLGGIAYRLTVAHGTCASVVSKTDLLEFPLQ